MGWFEEFEVRRWGPMGYKMVRVVPAPPALFSSRLYRFSIRERMQARGIEMVVARGMHSLI